MNLWICLARVSDEMGGGGRRMNVELYTYRMSHQHTVDDKQALKDKMAFICWNRILMANNTILMCYRILDHPPDTEGRQEDRRIDKRIRQKLYHSQVKFLSSKYFYYV